MPGPAATTPAAPAPAWLAPAAAACGLAAWLCWNARLWLAWRANQLPAFDFGIFAQLSGSLARGGGGRLSLLNNTHWLGDHFQPVFWVVAPVIRLAASPYALIVVETGLVAAAAVPVARLALRAGAPPVAALGLSIATLLHRATWDAVLFPVHPTTWVGPLLVFALAALDSRRFVTATVLCALALCCKEDVGFYLVGLGAWLAMARGSPRLGGALAIVCGAWSLVCVTELIPWFRGGDFHMFDWAPQLRDGAWMNPLTTARAAVDTGAKVRLWVGTLGSFAFLPLLDPLGVALVPYFAERVLGSNPQHVAPGWHYGAPAVTVLALAAAGAIGRLTRRAPHPGVPWLLLAGIAVGVVADWTWAPATPRPSLAALYAAATSDDARAVDEAVGLIAPGASVVAQDTLVARLADRERVAVLARRPLDSSRYVLVDVTLPDAPGILRPSIRALQGSKKHVLVYSDQGVALWERVKSGQTAPQAVPLSPRVAAFMDGA